MAKQNRISSRQQNETALPQQMEWRPTDSLRLHSQAERVPRMNREQFADFIEDIRERGIIVPLEVIDRETILDGRMRWLAAKELGLNKVPVVSANLGTLNPVVYMLRAACHRRHLTDDQRACLAQEELAFLAAQGRQRRAAAGGKARGADSMTRQFGRESVTRDRSTDARTLVAGAYGISQRRVRDAQRLQRDVPNLFEKVRSGEVRLTVARREAERDAKRRRHQELSQSVAARQESRTWNIITGDTIETMRQMKAESVRLIFADPVYNIGVDYGRGTGADRLPEADYLGWCRDWLTECQRLLSDDGSLWVLINDDYADHFGLLLRKTGLHRRAWIKWYETFGVNCTNNFNCCSRHLYYHVKHPRRFVFDSDAVSRPSDRQSKYADKRAAPHGKLWDNVWCIPRLVENSRERLPDFPTQLPLELVRPIVQCASEPGDLVLDPFAGSGTTGVAAIEGGRQFIGIELNPQFAKAARQRLMVAASQQKPSNSMKSEKRRAA